MDFTGKTPGWGRNGEATCRSSQLHRILSLPSLNSNFPYYISSSPKNPDQPNQSLQRTWNPHRIQTNKKQTPKQSRSIPTLYGIMGFYYHRNKQKPPQVACFPSTAECTIREHTTVLGILASILLQPILTKKAFKPMLHFLKSSTYLKSDKHALQTNTAA